MKRLFVLLMNGIINMVDAAGSAFHCTKCGAQFSEDQEEAFRNHVQNCTDRVHHH